MSCFRCPICGKVYEQFGLKEYMIAPRTTLFGNIRIKDIYGNVVLTHRRLNKPVCSKECKDKNEWQYFVEKYKDNNIYCVDGKYMPYLECDYWYDTIEEVKDRIDNPHLIPATPTLMHGLNAAMSGEPGNV